MSYFLNKYKEEINAWDWEAIKKDALENIDTETEPDNPIGYSWLGSVLCIFPSGKYYTPWANSNVNIKEALKDERFREALECIATKYNMFPCNPEWSGDFCDLYMGINIE